MLVDCAASVGVDHVPAGGPGGAEQGGDYAEVSETGGGFGSGVAGFEEVKEPPLGLEHARVWARWSRAFGLVQAGSAGTSLPPSGGGLVRVRMPALGRVQGAVRGPGNQLRRRPPQGVALRASVLQEHLVVWAGEDDRQVPYCLPRSAVVLLDGAAVTGQALRAVAREVVEQPVLA